MRIKSLWCGCRDTQIKQGNRIQTPIINEKKKKKSSVQTFAVRNQRINGVLMMQVTKQIVENYIRKIFMDWDNQQYKDANLFKLMQKLNVIPMKTPIKFLQTHANSETYKQGHGPQKG